MQRLILKMTQDEIADALGLTYQQIQKYENGSNRISASRLQSLCAILKVPVSFFFDGLPDVPETDSESAALTALGFLYAASDASAIRVSARLARKFRNRWGGASSGLTTSQREIPDEMRSAARSLAIENHRMNRIDCNR
jgi:transcriptional regulator with XRE-family HTH domain